MNSKFTQFLAFFNLIRKFLVKGCKPFANKVLPLSCFTSFKLHKSPTWIHKSKNCLLAVWKEQKETLISWNRKLYNFGLLKEMKEQLHWSVWTIIAFMKSLNSLTFLSYNAAKKTTKRIREREKGTNNNIQMRL